MFPTFALTPSKKERFSTVSLFCINPGNTFHVDFSSSGQYHSSDMTPSVFILSSTKGFIKGFNTKSKPLSIDLWSSDFTPYATSFAMPTICSVGTTEPRTSCSIKFFFSISSSFILPSSSTRIS